MTTLSRLSLIIALACFLSALSFVSAAQLLCLNSGQTVHFSQCNPDIDDRTCTSSGGCQYCVNRMPGNVYCPASINECHSSPSCTFLPDAPIDNNSTNGTSGGSSNSTGMLSVILGSPADRATVGTSVTFSYDVVHSTLVKNCTLFVNGRSRQTNQSTVLEQNNVFTQTLTLGNSTWFVECYDRQNRRTASVTRRLTVTNSGTSGGSSVGPRIDLFAPSDGYSGEAGQTSVSFEFAFANMSVSQRPTQCSHVLNGNAVSLPINTLSFTSRNNITLSVEAGSYTWSIRCTNQTQGALNSETRTFTIAAAAPAGGSSGGGGGGGGGGSHRSSTTRTSQNATQNTTVIVLNSPITEEQTSSNLSSDGSAPITGAAVGQFSGAMNGLLIAFVILIIAGLLLVFIYWKKRKKQKSR